MRSFHFPGRSPVRSMNGMAATSHPLATSAALDCLRRGGNAVDAAVCASAVLTVVEPHMTGIGGDCFAIIAEPDGSLHGLNGSGRAAMAADASALRASGMTRIDPYSPHAVTVPGSVKAWEALVAGFGRLGFDTALQPAIALAEQGAPVTDRVAHDWAGLVGRLKLDAGATRHYLVKGAAPKAGDIFAQPALGRTLRYIADHGADGFYRGPVADDIIATLASKGSVLSHDDLLGVSADPVTPILARYRGLTIAELPPSGQGIVALIILKLLERFDLAGMAPHSAERVHLEIEAARLAYAMRDVHVADPATMRVSVEAMLSEASIAALAARIDPARRMDDLLLPDLPDADTVYLSVADDEGRMVSFINSIYHGFGSGIVAPESGVTLQNRGACFTLEEGHVNELAPGKRPMHTIIPAMALREGRPVMSFGVMGGAYQPCGHAHVIANMLDYGMDPQEALDAPRAFWDDDGVVRLEAPYAEEVLDALRRRGHAVERAVDPLGGGQIIARDPMTGALTGASDPRKDGAALGY